MLSAFNLPYLLIVGWNMPVVLILTLDVEFWVGILSKKKVLTHVLYLELSSTEPCTVKLCFLLDQRVLSKVCQYYISGRISRDIYQTFYPTIRLID